VRRARGLAAAALAGLGLAAGSAGCRDAAPDPRPSLLLVTLDTTRFDHTTLGGYGRDTTPRLAALAREGASFELAYAPTSTTGPTHATLFTGLSPLRHRVLKNGVPLEASAETLAERLAGLGWRTGAFVSSFVVSRRFGFDQGFDAYDDRFERATSTYTEKFWEGQAVRDAFDRRGNATTDRALRWLEANAGRAPLFAWVHYFDPHAPYVPPEGFAGRFEPAPVDGGLVPPAGRELARDVARYDEEIAFADAELGRLLDALERLGLAANTIVAVTADHGEGLMDHGHMEHGVHIYEEQVRVPLVLRWPGRIAPARLPGPVELADLRPTLEALLGLDPVAGAEGRSLAHALTAGAPLEPERPVHLYRRHFAGEQRGDTFVRGEKFGVRVGRWKLIDGPEEGTRELFDLAADPGERENRAADAPEVAAELAARLAAWRAGRVGEATPLAITPEERERLRALGYTE
jgi:arylsulfatase A-like enzyme